MKRQLKQIVVEFRAHWKNYVFQSLLATIAVFIIFWALGVREAVIIASLGATSFVIFALPHSLMAKPRNVIGGHIVGLVCGVVGAILADFVPDMTGLSPGQFAIACNNAGHAAAYAVSVGLAIFIMVVIDTEHAPAAGTALGIAINGFSINIAATVMLFAVLMVLIRRLLRKYMRDLT